MWVIFLVIVIALGITAVFYVYKDEFKSDDKLEAKDFEITELKED